jgi:hypothetical protein
VTDLFRRVSAITLLAGPILIPFPGLAQSGENCTFKVDPDSYAEKAKRIRVDVSNRSASFAAARMKSAGASGAEAASTVRLVDPNSIPRQNFIDDAIFGRMAKAGVKSAPLSTDAEFVRRIYLDLTGRIPSPTQVRQFMTDPDPPTKRSRLIQDLLYSEAWADKWTWWMDEWVGNRSSSASGAYQNQNAQGRNALHKYLWMGVINGRPIRDMAFEMLSGTGTNYEEATGATNFMVSSRTFNGPNEDTYDTMAVRSANVFWGVSHYDCLMCHGGRAHLEPINLWASKVTRLQAQQMSAFFARTNPIAYSTADRTNFYSGSFDVQDVTNRGYSMRTSYGNRPNRTPIGTTTSLTPEFTFSHGGKPSGNAWRQDFAKFAVAEPMFARNLANRLWKQVFNLGLVDPVDSMDPARLDPSNPPGEGWSLQAANPQLLEDLAGWLASNDFSLRGYLRLLTESSAYQLSSEYPGTWNVDLVPMFARHYVRRLEAEEIHDAITKATGVIPNYTVTHWAAPMNWAMQLPDTSEPSDATARNFMNTFNRGNRETQPRQQNSTTLQQLALMNDNFVVPKIKVANSPAMKEIVKLTSNDAVAEELFLTFLSRMPSDNEKAKAAAHIAKAPNANQRNAYIEDLAWALVNKIDFLFSY